MRIPSYLVVLAAVVACAGTLACEDAKKPAGDSAKGDAGAAADKYASADPKLEKALKAAASASASANAGPPPTGIFEVGVADLKHAKGAPTKVDMLSEGADPKVSLTVDASADAARATSYGPAAMQLAMSLGPRLVLPTVDFGMVLTPGKKDEGGSDWLVGNVVRSTPSKQQMGQLPPGMDKDIASFQGSELRVKVTADGRESDLLLQLAKGAKADLGERLVENAAEALVFATVPVPPKPVGVGGQWIAETRMPLSGVDAIAYRAYKVKSIDGNRVHLTVDVKAYATSKDVNFPGLPKGATFEQFDAESEGEVELVKGETVARKSDVQQRVVMIFVGPGGVQPPAQPGQQPGNMLPVQLTSQATFVRGDDLKAAMKQP
ncbi:MAG TPA: hypothetical protein VIF09_19190 [Polyangiaceae bacterium]|jgi:hypothetical protein